MNEKPVVQKMNNETGEEDTQKTSCGIQDSNCDSCADFKDETDPQDQSARKMEAEMADQSGIRIEILSAPCLNLSLLQTSFTLIDNITIVSERDDIKQACIKVSSGADIFDPLEFNTDIIQKGEIYSLSSLVKNLIINADKLASLTEDLHSRIVVEILDGSGNSIARKSAPLTINTFNQWTGDGNPELLASFVTPNSAAVPEMLNRAREKLSHLITHDKHLKNRYEANSGLQGYIEDDPQFSVLQAQALFLAIQDLGLSYLLPPPSFTYGQRIRLPDEVISGKAGTCIDTSIFYASLLESVGLHPVLVITSCHAFAGVWLTDKFFEETIITDKTLIESAVNRRELLLFETTLFCDKLNGSVRCDFDQLVKSGEENLRKKDDFSYLVDIKAARIFSIKPLPTIARNEEGKITLVEDPRFVRNSRDTGNAYKIRQAPQVKAVNDAPLTREQIWKNKLLDLSMRNNLLNMHTKTGRILRICFGRPEKLEDLLRELSDVCFKLSETPLNISEKIGSEDTDIPQEIIASMEENTRKQHTLLVDNPTSAPLDRLLRKIYNDAQDSLNENGANSLFIGLYSVVWYDGISRINPHKAPLLLLPVDIMKSKSNNGYALRIRDEELIVNSTLVEMTRQLYDISLGSSENITPDEWGVDVLGLKDLVESRLPAGWQIKPDIYLGNFSFRKFVMWQDIDQNSALLEQSSVYAALKNGKFTNVPSFGADEIPSTVDDRFTFGDTCVPIMADSSQLDAVIAVKSGKSFVLQGPPGTGKSQTITNIIASAVRNDKKVLFVAAKKAALEVVEERLSKLGLAPYCLELHSNTLTKGSFLERLSTDLPEEGSEYPQDYEIIKGKLIRERDELNQERHALHNISFAGMSAYDAMCFLIKEDFKTDILIDPGFVPEIDLKMIVNASDALREIKILNQGKDITDYPYRSTRLTAMPEGQVPVDKSRFLRESQSLTDFQTSLKQLLDLGKDLESLDTLLIILDNLDNIAQIQEQDLSAFGVADFQEFRRLVSDALAGVVHIEKVKKNLGGNWEGLLKQDLRTMINRWKLDDEKFIIFRALAHKKSLNELRLIVGVDVPLTKNNYVSFLESAENLDEDVKKLDKLIEKIKEQNARFAELIREEPAVAQVHMDNLVKIADALITGLQPKIAKHLEKSLGQAAKNHTDLKEDLVKLCSYATQVRNYKKDQTALQTYFKADTELLPEKLEEKNQVYLSWLEETSRIPEWLELNKRIRTLRANGFQVISDALLKGIISLDVGEFFARGLFAQSVVNKVITENSCLAGFNRELFEDRMSAFNKDTAIFRESSRKELLNYLRNKRQAALNRADLADEITCFKKFIKSRGRKVAIRQCFSKLPRLLPEMYPCMLMSPMSVAQYLAPDTYKFDLIIFDEASQLPTSEAVGAIGRGSQVIVVGDPRQMPPTDFFNAKQADVPDEIADLESVLDDCMTLGMPVKTLSWHYRSRHESLISFSNHMYYEDKLYTFPSPDDQTSRVSFHYVDGIYDRGGTGCNKEESAQVAQYLKDFLNNKDNKDTSIGIVTFNTRQQGQIEDDIDKLKASDPEIETKLSALKEPLFIKNLENVQGDERDVIVFSIGFGKDKTGAVSMNFGPLNREGGERRLNVAVTRSKKEMVVFSSLTPEDSRLGPNAAKGARGVFDFLSYARRGAVAISRQLDSKKTVLDELVMQLAADLKKNGFETTYGIGTSSFKIDLAVKDPENPSQYLACIMSDGYVYKNTPGAQDRFIGQPGVLKGLGWKVLRFFAVDFWRDRERTVNRLVAELKAIQNSRS